MPLSHTAGCFHPYCSSGEPCSDFQDCTQIQKQLLHQRVHSEIGSLVVSPCESHKTKLQGVFSRWPWGVCLRVSLSISVTHCAASSLRAASRIPAHLHLHPATRHQFTPVLDLCAHHLPDVCVGVFALHGSLFTGNTHTFSRSRLSPSHTRILARTHKHRYSSTQKFQ